MSKPKRGRSPKPSKLFTAKLRSSALGPADAKRLAFRLLTAAEASELLPDFTPRPGFVIPYFDDRGKLLKDGFFRFRYLGDTGSFLSRAGQVGSPSALRYVQPRSTAPHIYLPPNGTFTWADVVADPSIPIIVTEGELKAAAASRLDYPTIGLGGVYAFKSKKAGVDFLPELERFRWDDRKVVVAFDADVAVKPQVRAALTALAGELTGRSARVFEAVLPDLGDGKTGIDDLIAAEGHPGLRRILEAAEMYEPSRALWEFSNQVAYVKNPASFVDFETGQLVSKSTLTETMYPMLTHTETFVDGHGNTKVKKRRTAEEWVRWQHRNAVGTVEYAPGSPVVTERGNYNFWRDWGVAPVKGDVGPWSDLLKFVFNGDADRVRWFETWAAYPIQYPGTKLLTAVLIWGRVEGTGKSLIAHLLGDVYGRGPTGNFAEAPGAELLRAHFNERLRHKQFILVEELKGEDGRADAEKLKVLITQEQLTINAKYQPEYTIADTVNYLLTSNHSDCLKLPSEDERRMFVNEVRAPVPMPDEWYTRIIEWREKGGPAALHYYLLHDVDTSDFNPKAKPPLTDDKIDMVGFARSDADDWLATLLADPAAVFADMQIVAPSDLWTSTQLLTLYDPDGRKRLTANGVGRALRRLGLRMLVVRTAAGTKKLWPIMNREKWEAATGAARATHYNDCCPGGGPKKVKF